MGLETRQTGSSDHEPTKRLSKIAMGNLIKTHEIPTIYEVKPKTPGDPIKITLFEKDRLDAGGINNKNLLKGYIGDHEVSLVERPFSRNYIEAWETFKKAGLPVVPTLREGSKGTLLLTDLKHDGSELYGITLLEKMTKKFEERSRPNRALDDVFLQLTSAPKSFSKIKEKVDEAIETVNQNGFLLPNDDPFELIIHPDNKWELMILDLDQANTQPHQLNERTNQVSRGYFISVLERIRDQLLEEKR